MARTRSWTKRNGSPNRQNVTKSAKKATPKAKIKKVNKHVQQPPQTSKSHEQLSPPMVSIPIDVIYALNSSSMQHFSVNDLKDIKMDVNEPTDNRTTDTTLSQSLRDVRGQEDLAANPTEPMVSHSSTEKFVEQTLPSGAVNSCSTPVKLEHDVSTVYAPNGNDEPMLGMISIPADVVFLMNTRLTRNLEEFEIPKVEILEKQTIPTALGHVSNESSKMNEDPTKIIATTEDLSQSQKVPVMAVEEVSLSSDESFIEPINYPMANTPKKSSTSQYIIFEHTPTNSTSVSSSKQQQASPVRTFSLGSISTDGSIRCFSHKSRLDVSPTSTIIKEECRSPTSTIIKEECRSPTSTIIREECWRPVSIVKTSEDSLEHSAKLAYRSRSHSLCDSDASMHSVEDLPRTFSCGDDNEISSKYHHASSQNSPLSHSSNVSEWTRLHSTPTHHINNSFYSTPSSTPEKTAMEDDSDSDYGWEDPAPPKLKPEPKSQSMLEDPIFTEKIQNFKSKLQNEYDWDVIQTSKKEMFQVIEETIALEAQRKLNELDRKIRKEKDDYVRKMFGTDNFDSWDDDPALSNVDVTAKLKPFKCLVPDDGSLLEKMRMTNVINATKLTHASGEKKLVFMGRIKQIETEFEGKKMPRDLFQSIKEEKKMISDLVIKFLLPYYNTGRIQQFAVCAREISHKFYQTFSDEDIIKTFIDNLFCDADV